MIDKRLILERTDLITLITHDLGERINRSGRYLFWHCPLHDGDYNPSLAVTEDNQRWHCFACGKGGDAITWMMEYHHIRFKEAIQRLGVGNVLSGVITSRVNTHKLESKEKPMPDNKQTEWRAIVEDCQKRLWTDTGARARTYLNRRGLREETLHYWQVGYHPDVRMLGLEEKPNTGGIVIPCFVGDYLHYIKVRLPHEENKYKKLPGNGANLQGLFGADTSNATGAAFICEGEFDAMLLHQEAGDLVKVMTLGACSEMPNLALFGRYLLEPSKLFIAYDLDKAGEDGFKRWEKALPARVFRVYPPQENETDKDITDAYKASSNLQAWVLSILAEHGLQKWIGKM